MKRSLPLLLLLIFIVFGMVPVAQAQQCVANSTPELSFENLARLQPANNTVGVDLHEYAILLHDIAAIDPVTKEPICDKGEFGEQLRNAFGARIEAELEKDFDFHGFLVGGSVSFAYATGAILGARGELTPQMDRVLGQLQYNPFLGSEECGHTGKTTFNNQEVDAWTVGNDCMDVLTVATEGFAWRYAYFTFRGTPSSDRSSTIFWTRQSLLNTGNSLCVYDSAKPFTDDAGPCNATISDLRTSPTAQLIPLNHRMENANYGIGLVSSLANAYLALDVAGDPVTDTDYGTRVEDVKTSYKALWQQGQRSAGVNPGDEPADPTNGQQVLESNLRAWATDQCVRPSPDNALLEEEDFILRNRPCWDQQNTQYRLTTYPVKAFYEQYVDPQIGQNFPGYQFDEDTFSYNKFFDGARFKDPLGFWGVGRYMIYYKLGYEWFARPEVRPAFRSFTSACGTTATAHLTGDSTIFLGQKTPLTVTFTGQGPYKIEWSDGHVDENIAVRVFTREVQPQVSGEYTITSVTGGDCPGTPTGRAAINVVESGLITVDNVTASSGAFTPSRARLTDAVGNPIPGKELRFKVMNAAIGSGVTNSDGRVEVFAAISDLKPGAYPDAIEVVHKVGDDVFARGTATLTITCNEYTLLPPRLNLSAAAQTVTVLVGTTSECPWTPVADQPWIGVTINPDPDADPTRPNDPPDGNGSFNVTVPALSSGTRTGKITVGPKTIPVVQSAGCSMAFANDVVYLPDNPSGFTRIDILAPADCEWAVTTDASWLDIEDNDGLNDGTLNGKGQGEVIFRVERNRTTIRRRGKLFLTDKATGELAYTASINQLQPPAATCPVLRQGIGSGSVRDWQNVAMRVIVDGSPLEYRWFVNGQLIRQGDDPALASLTLGPGQGGYPGEHETNSYRVEVSNSCGTVVSQASWTNHGNTGPCRVPGLADSTFHTNAWPSDQDSPGGSSNVRMFIQASWGLGSPRTKPLEFQWYRGISPDEDSDIDGATTDELKVSPNSDAYYWVKVTDPECGSNWSRTAKVTITRPPGPTKRRAVGFDFTGDGNSDILWHNPSTGQNQIWEMFGTTRNDTKDLPQTNPVTPQAQIQSVGDFDGDNRPDIVWRDPVSGRNDAWIMNSYVFRGSSQLEGRSGAEWSIGAVADLDGDESHDIVWHNSITRENEIWFQQGTAHEGTWALPPSPTGSWGLHGTADFNRDGRPDLFFHDRATGSNSVWIMNDAERASVQSDGSSLKPQRRFSVRTQAMPSMTNLAFVPMQIADMNRDGWPDIVWRNQATGENTVWMMLGTMQNGPAVELEPRDPSWTIGGGGGTPTNNGGPGSRTATSISVTATTAAFNSATAITARLTTANGTPVGGRTLTFTVNGNPAGSIVTDANGEAVSGASVAGIAAGAHPNAIAARFAGDTTYAPSEGAADLVVQQAVPVITWNDPAPVTYGTILGAAQLNAIASVPGTFTHSPSAGTVPDGGYNALTAVFTPSDPSMSTVTKTVVLFVNPAPVAITWPAPGAIAYGTALSATHLNASTGVAGRFTYAPPAGTILGVGTHTLQVAFTPNAPANYTTATASRTIEVIQGTQTISWQTPATIVYGTPLTAAQLNATVTATAAPPSGALTYNPPAGTILPAGTHTLTVTAAATEFYAAAAKSVTLIVIRAQPAITWAVPAPIVYGTALSASQLHATANVPGTFVYTPAAGTVLNAGTHTLSVQFTPSDAGNYESASSSVTVVVQKAKPAIVWPVPASIVYGTPLSATQLNATANVPGTFVYAPGAGTILNAGTHPLSVQFTPSDASNYESANASSTILVTKAAQTLSWTSPAAIVYGTLLSATQLNATVSVVGPSPAGALTYNPPAGTLLQAGNGQVLTVNAAETANYEPATLSVTIDVLKQKPVLTWAQPAPIVYRAALSSTQLNATSNVAGSFAYAPPAGTVLEAGTHTLSAHFTPSDTRNYEEGDVTTMLEVQQATPIVTWANPAGIVYGTALSTQLNATADVPGTVTYDPAAGTILDAGPAQTLSVHFKPTDTRNFKEVDASVTIDVAKAPQTLAWATPAPIVYGTPLTSVQLNASVSVVGPAAAGALVYTPAAGAVLDAGSHTLIVVAQETANYESATSSVSIAVHRAPLSLTVDAKAKLYGSPVPTLTGTLTGVVNGDPITPSYATTATQQSGTATYPITGTLVDPANRLVNYDVTITNATLVIHPAPLTISADPKSKQYNDPLPQFTATFTGLVLGQTPAVLHGTLVIETTAVALSAPGTYPIAIGGLTSPNYAITYVGSTLTVTAEDARVIITSPLFATASAPAPARITLSATVKDISATADAAGDTSSGDIRNATLAFVDRATGATLCTAPIGLASADDQRIGVATCTFTGSFPTGTSSLVLGARVGGYYTRDDASDDVTMTIAAPTADFVTGGGSTASGAFNVNIQYDKKGLKGTFTLKTTQYEITATMLDSLAIQRSATGGTAYIAGTATLRDTATGAMLDPAAPLLVTATDDGEPSTRDTLSVTVLKKDGGFWLITGWDVTRPISQPLANGNVQVHQAK